MPGNGRRLTSKHCLRTTNHPPRRSAASSEAPEKRDQGNRAPDPTIRLFNTYRRLIRAQVPARLDRVVAEIPEQCEGERCLRLKLTVVREGFFDVIDEEELDALDPTNEQDAERVEALREELRGQLRP